MRGSGGGAPVRPLPRQRRERPGVRRGRSIPSPEHSVDTLCRLAYAQVGLPALALCPQMNGRSAVYPGSPAPSPPARNVAHCSMSPRRRSNRSVRR